MRLLPALLAAGAMAAVPATALADGELAPAFDPLYHTQSGTYSYDGAVQVFTVAVSQLDSSSNQQGVTGSFNGVPFTGVMFDHTYDAVAETGHYAVAGTLNVPGAPVPVLGFIDANMDRNHGTFVFSYNGSLGGRSFSGVSQPIVNPLYKGL